MFLLRIATVYPKFLYNALLLYWLPRFNQPGTSGVFLYKRRYHILQFTLLFMLMAGVVGFEPTMQESKSYALPLGYTPSMLSQKSTYLLDASLNTVSFSLNNMHYSIFLHICQDHFQNFMEISFHRFFVFIVGCGTSPHNAPLSS